MIVPFVTDVDEEKAGYHADLDQKVAVIRDLAREFGHTLVDLEKVLETAWSVGHSPAGIAEDGVHPTIAGDRKSTRLNSSHVAISYAVFCLKKKNKHESQRAHRGTK